MSVWRNPSELPKGERPRMPQVVAGPAPHEGVKRALLGSYGSFPAMPDEFARLLDRLN